MAKQRTENAPPAALWKDTFSDLMNLLLCFFVMMQAIMDAYWLAKEKNKKYTPKKYRSKGKQD